MMTAHLTLALSHTQAENVSRQQSTPDDFSSRLRECDDQILLRGMVEDLLLLPEAGVKEGFGIAHVLGGCTQERAWETSTARKRLEAIKARMA